ncbi:hypothetical protein [Psychromonas aquimarina]|uniref:hypothetical protein n=1 Tax=Psychromonas aquimarina TaxID=444919 RepID=UPI000404A77B|nr:hypothetical protein [Psychromonas aquimarina]
MQINGYQQIQSMVTAPSAPAAETQKTNSGSAAEPGVQVSISAQALQLAQTDNLSVSSTDNQIPAAALPGLPENPLTGDKLQQYAQFKKALLQYQVHSDMANMVTGSGGSMSAPTAYYLSNNEDARETVLQQQAMHQQAQNMQVYQQTMQSAEEE